MILLQAILTASLLLVANLRRCRSSPVDGPRSTVKLGWLYAVLFLVYGCAQFARAARTALIGDLVAEPDLPQASGLIETMASLSFMLGFGIAPLLFVPFGIGFALIADALSFVVAFIVILGVEAPPSARSVKRGERGSVRREFFEGLRFSLRQSRHSDAARRLHAGAVRLGRDQCALRLLSGAGSARAAGGDWRVPGRAWRGVGVGIDPRRRARQACWPDAHLLDLHRC